jgi:threonine/homoserine/homoserine lactone efflux protein
MIAIFYGVEHVLQVRYTKGIISLVGGLSLLWMGFTLLRSSGQAERHVDSSAHSPIVAGVLLSVGNPAVFVWWATVGAALILRSVRFGTLGFAAFAGAHWMCDFVWDYLLSALSFRGGKVLGPGFHKGIFLICGAFLTFFGGRFVVDGISTLLL